MTDTPDAKTIEREVIEREVIATVNAPQAIGAYSQANKCAGMLYISGQIPLRPDGTLVAGDIDKEIRQCFANLAAIAEAAGTSLAHAVKLTIYLTDLNNFAVLNSICPEYLSEQFPARATVQVAALPKGARVEIDAIVRA